MSSPAHHGVGNPNARPVTGTRESETNPRVAPAPIGQVSYASRRCTWAGCGRVRWRETELCFTHAMREAKEAKHAED